MSKNVIDCAIDLVDTRGRFRKDFGDIPALAKDIEEIGLLQPIGIDSGYRLVFGERRLRAFSHLGRKTIPAIFIDLDSLIRGEKSENDMRKDFTTSEQVAIGKALESELVGRNHRPIESPENFPDLPKGDTRDLAAKAAGFGNGKTYEQAKTIVESGVPELVQAVDSGTVSVSAGAVVAKLPPADQQAVVAAGAAKEVARKARKRGKPTKNSASIKEEINAAQHRGESMLLVFGRQLLAAIVATESINDEERDLLSQIESAINSTKGNLQ